MKELNFLVMGLLAPFNALAGGLPLVGWPPLFIQYICNYCPYLVAVSPFIPYRRSMPLMVAKPLFICYLPILYKFITSYEAVL
jgi:hypothetical protein